MKFKCTRTLLATLLAAAGATAAADEGLSANVALASDYLFRGVSQTDNQMAVQGGFDWSHASGFYLGTWASNVDSHFFSGNDRDPQIEWDLYAGFSGEAGDLGYDLGAIRYVYPGYSNANTTEVYVGGTYQVTDGASLGAKVYYSPKLKFAGVSKSAWYLSLDGDFEVVENVKLAGHVGFSDGNAYDSTASGGLGTNYTDYKIGVSTSLAGVDLDLSWVDTDSDGSTLFGNLADGRLVLTLSKSF